MLLLGLGEFAGPVVDALGVQPDTHGAFFLIVGLVVPRPVMTGRKVRCDLAQALLPPGRIGVTLGRIVPPPGNRIQSLGIDRGQGAGGSVFAAAGQPFRQSGLAT